MAIVVVEKKAAEYYWANKDILKEKAKNKYKNMSEEEKETTKNYSKNRYKEMKRNAILLLHYKNE